MRWFTKRRYIKCIYTFTLVLPLSVYEMSLWHSWWIDSRRSAITYRTLSVTFRDINCTFSRWWLSARLISDILRCFDAIDGPVRWQEGYFSSSWHIPLERSCVCYWSEWYSILYCYWRTELKSRKAKRAFFYAGPVAWNSPPVHVRDEEADLHRWSF